MKRFLTALLICAILALSVPSIRVVGNASAYPTSQTQTLMTAISPEDATRGQTLSWLIWTDPPITGAVTLSIIDLTNHTTVSKGNENLGTLNGCGSLAKTVSTAGYLAHSYVFVANMTVGNMKIESRRYIDFSGNILSIYVYATPFYSLVGDRVNVTITEFNYPSYLGATANMTISNTTNPSIYTVKNIAISASNGSRIIGVPTSLGLTAGTYSVDVNATSTLGDKDTATTIFIIKDIMLSVESEYIGQPVNVSIRTSPTVSQSGLSLTFTDFALFIETKYVDQYVPLTNGAAAVSFSSADWPPSVTSSFWIAVANATIGSRDVSDTVYFYLDPFTVDVDLDRGSYLLGSDVNITITTTPIQSGAAYNLSVTNSTLSVVWQYGPSSLNSQGAASIIMPTIGLPAGTYDVDVTVDNGEYQVTDGATFDLYARTFNVYAVLDSSYVYSGYAMPQLNITTNPGQVNANLTLEINFDIQYNLTKTGFDASQYLYSLPLPVMANGTYFVEVTVKSAVGSNSTFAYLYYSDASDADGDTLSNAQEASLGTNSNNPDSDGDGFFDGMEVFHQSNPTNPTILVPEFPQPAAIGVLLATLSALLLIIKRKAGSQIHRATYSRNAAR